jgi:hypothetical protein
VTDQSRVMRTAWREWRYARMKGGHVDEVEPVCWGDCIRFAHAQERARKPSSFAALQAATRDSLARESGPGVLWRLSA